MQTIQDIILCLLLSAITASFSFFLDFCLGKPMSEEFSMKAIFFPYSNYLALRRVKPIEKIELKDSFAPLLNSDDPKTREDGQSQMKKSLFILGRDRFSWEQPFGMCPYCSNFWVCQLAALIFYFTIPLSFINPIFFFLIVPIFSHSILRKL